MGIGISVFLIAMGAILTFAVNLPATGIDLNAVGVILMGVGFVLFVYTLVWWSEAMPWRHDRAIIREEYVEPRHEHYVEPRIDEVTPIRRERVVTEYHRRAG
jgi:hypothetical protein